MRGKSPSDHWIQERGNLFEGLTGNVEGKHRKASLRNFFMGSSHSLRVSVRKKILKRAKFVRHSTLISEQQMKRWRKEE